MRDLEDELATYRALPTPQSAPPAAESTPVVPECYLPPLEGTDNSQPVYAGPAACTAFTTHLQGCLKGDAALSGPLPAFEVFHDPGLKRQVDPRYYLPSRIYAERLTLAFLRFVGDEYHLINAESFAENMVRVYSNEIGPDHTFLCKMFLVLALGELYLKKSTTLDGRRIIPGTSFFKQAILLLQDMYEEPDAEYIETLLLAVRGLGVRAFRLFWSN